MRYYCHIYRESESYTAEIEVRSNGEAEREEITNLRQVEHYLEGATKAAKGVSRKRAKQFQLVDGVLHYKKTLKLGQLRLRQVTNCS